MTDAVRWPHVPYDQLVDLSDERLTEYITYWTQQMQGFRRARAAVTKDHPQAFHTGYSGWWCSKYVSAGLYEQRRRTS